ncbi:hypothetical protein MKX08_005666 [Trichoderma sp. CBMAI-0020]|nr:hypothetical protein MKX08_005666 [Trichoderma sp. CBMAI-0020]
MPSFVRSTAYAALAKQDDDDASSTETLMPMSIKQTRQSRLVWCSIMLIAINSILLVILVGAVLVLYSTQRSAQQQSLLDNINTNSLLSKASGYSPVFDRYTFSFEKVFHKNELLSDDVLRQRPNNATEEAWHELSKLSTITISADDVRKLGQDPAKITHMPGDPNSFPAMLSVTHQLHCINHLRMGLEGPHYLHGKERSRHDWEHLYHCLHFLTQIATCHSDVDLILWHWYENMIQPQPEFSGDFQCRNFDGLKSWVDTVGFPTSDVWYFKREGGEHDWPVDPAYLEYLRQHPEENKSDAEED